MFQKFQFCELFNEASKNYERIVEDKEANDNLDPLIEEFLLSISPYMMLKASLKCFEWLINRYQESQFISRTKFTNIGSVLLIKTLHIIILLQISYREIQRGSDNGNYYAVL